MARSKKITTTPEQREPVIACLVNDNTWKAFGDATAGLERVGWSEQAIEELCKRQDVRAVLVEAELIGNGAEYADFHGLQLARDLRRKYKVRWPIVVTSALPEDLFLNSSRVIAKDDPAQILLTSGTGFVHLRSLSKKSISDALKYIPVLSPSGLVDISSAMLDHYGFLSNRVAHDLRPSCSLDERKELVQGVASSLTEEERRSVDFGRYENGLFAEPVIDRDFYAAQDQLAAAIAALATAGPGSGNATTKHRIILVEDNDDARAKYERILGAKHFTVQATSQASKAIEWIDADEKNKVRGIISDWRLWVPGSSPQRMQQKQGYDVLAHATRKRHVALFALTSLREPHINEIRNRLGIDFWLLLKRELDRKEEEDWGTELSVIRQRCERVATLISSLPTGDNWTLDYYTDYRQGNKVRVPFDSLDTQYRTARNAPGWDIVEERITVDADKYWNYCSTAVLDKTIANAGLVPLEEKFQVKLPPKVPKLEITLSFRRVYLGLWYSSHRMNQVIKRTRGISSTHSEDHNDESPAIKVYCVVHGTSWEQLCNEKPNTPLDPKKQEKGEYMEEDIFKELTADAKALAHRLCIKTSDLPDGILPEERSWLHSKGVDVESVPPVEDYTSDGEEEDDDASARTSFADATVAQEAVEEVFGDDGHTEAGELPDPDEEDEAE